MTGALAASEANDRATALRRLLRSRRRRPLRSAFRRWNRAEPSLGARVRSIRVADKRSALAGMLDATETLLAHPL